MRLLSGICFMFVLLKGLTEANLTHSPRMIFTDKDTEMQRLTLPHDHEPVRIILDGQSDTGFVAGKKQIISFNLQDPQKTPEPRTVLWSICPQQEDCNYNITLVHERGGWMFVCGTNGRRTECCDMDLSAQSPKCDTTQKTGDIRRSMMEFIIKEGDPSALMETAEKAELYITYSGSQEFVGIHKFGAKRTGPANNNKEQHYVGLVLNKRTEDPLQNRVYAFYKEKNRDTDLYSEMWLPFVTQVCMADTGGPKNILQFTWTSQLNARLFCGDSASKQHFSELVDVATVHANQWQETKVYALFRNEWGMSAVCVYSLQDIDRVFTTSPFKDDHTNRPRACVPDSTKIPLDTLKMIEETSEMQNWVWPVNNSGPLLFKHHNYTHIHVDGSHHLRDDHHPVLFLSLNNGGVHKVIRNNDRAFVIAEYQPFPHRTHIVSLVLHPASRKLNVYSGKEVVQLGVANCTQYGNTCEQCVLARDPYCGWDGTRCTLASGKEVQDVAQGNCSVCRSTDGLNEQASRRFFSRQADKKANIIRLRSKSKYFLQCPVSSHHAQYTWRSLKNGNSHPCNSRDEHCLHLIDSMSLEQEGTYICESEEMGYKKVLEELQLQLENRAAGRSLSVLFWACLMAAVIMSLS